MGMCGWHHIKNNNNSVSTTEKMSLNCSQTHRPIGKGDGLGKISPAYPQITPADQQEKIWSSGFMPVCTDCIAGWAIIIRATNSNSNK